MTLVVNRMPSEKQARIDLEGLERLVPDAQGLVTVDEDQAAAARVAAGSFTWDDAPDRWARQVRELAVVMQSGWRDLGLTQ